VIKVRRIHAGQAQDYLSNELSASLQGPACDAQESLSFNTGGTWRGRGAALLGLTGPVADRQLENIFVDGLRPDADRLVQEWAATHRSGGGRRSQLRALDHRISLGRRWAVFTAENAWRTATYQAYRQFNLERGEHPGARIDPAVRTAVRLEVGRAEFRRRHGRDAADDDELLRFLRSVGHPAQGAVAGFEVLFGRETADEATSESSRAASIAAHTSGVEATLDQLEDVAAFTRVGTRPHQVVQSADGLIMAIFPVTRNDFIGTRVLVSAKVPLSSGQWLALDARPLYAAAAELDEQDQARCAGGSLGVAGVEPRR